MSGSKTANSDDIRFRGVFVPDGESLDSELLEGMFDPVILRAEFTPDQDDDDGSEPGTESGGS